jgi:hypothetical protein
MTILIKTTAFNLNELQSLSCYRYCNAIENNDSIQIEIEDKSISEFVDCLTINHNKFNLLFHNNAVIADGNSIIQGRMLSFQRKTTMIKIILDAIIQHTDFDIEILNNQTKI